ASKTVTKPVWVRSPIGPEQEMQEVFFASEKGKQFANTISSLLSKAGAEENSKNLRLHYVPKQVVLSLGFGDAGHFVFCGTRSGVCAIAWDHILSAEP